MKLIVQLGATQISSSRKLQLLYRSNYDKKNVIHLFVGPVSVHAACKGNPGSIYVDGVKAGESSRRTVLKSEFTSTPRLVAVICKRNSGTTGWILVSLSNGFISGNHWTSKNKDDPGWEVITFDDRSWDSSKAVNQANTVTDVSDPTATIWWRKPNNEGGQNGRFRGTVGEHCS